jgi:phosphoglycolate phosphatase-like HAD superfamily hydrolase
MANMHAAHFYPGADALLRRMKRIGARLGIITSKDELRTGAVLAMIPVTFDVVRTPDATTRGKPAPDHLLAAMATVGVDPAETIYIGDMDSDYEAACRARIDYAHASWGYGEIPPGCSTVLKEISDIEGLVSNVRQAAE